MSKNLDRQSLNEDQVIRRGEVGVTATGPMPTVVSGGGDGSIDDGVDDELDNDDDIDNTPDFPSDIQDAPKNLVIVKQVVNQRPGGFMTVDVIIEFDTVDTAVGYEYRIADVTEAGVS